MRVVEALGFRDGKPFLDARWTPFRLLLPPPCPPATTSPGEGLPGGLLKGAPAAGVSAEAGETFFERPACSCALANTIETNMFYPGNY